MVDRLAALARSRPASLTPKFPWDEILPFRSRSSAMHNQAKPQLADPGKGGLWVSGILVLLCGVITLGAEESRPGDRRRQEKERCLHNLKLIGQALQSYRQDRGEVPQWLSELVPTYLPDVTALTCPVSRRTGRMESPALADPKVPCSYLFEFSPAPLGNEAPSFSNRTRREWRMRQLEVLGPRVPVVRCRLHDPHLNLGLDGVTYESPPVWETLFTNQVDLTSLGPETLFTAPAVKPQVRAVLKFPPRAASTPPEMLDLGPVYNGLTGEPWFDAGQPENHLGSWGERSRELGGLRFDVRGVLQLAGRTVADSDFPVRVEGISVRQKCRRIHFLHAAVGGGPADEGRQIAAYTLTFVGNSTRLEIPVVYGRDLRNWHWQPGEPPAPPELRVVWHGENEVSRRAGRPIRLFLTSWANLVPDLEIETVGCVSNLAGPALFVLAITLE